MGCIQITPALGTYTSPMSLFFSARILLPAVISVLRKPVRFALAGAHCERIETTGIVAPELPHDTGWVSLCFNVVKRLIFSPLSSIPSKELTLHSWSFHIYTGEAAVLRREQFRVGSRALPPSNPRTYLRCMAFRIFRISEKYPLPAECLCCYYILANP